MNSTSSLILLSWTLNTVLNSNSTYSNIRDHYIRYLDALNHVYASVKKPGSELVVEELIRQSVPVPTLSQVRAAAMRSRLSTCHIQKLFQLTKTSQTLWRCLSHHVLAHNLLCNITMPKVQITCHN